MIKPFYKLLNRKKDSESSPDFKKNSEEKSSNTSKPLIIAGSIISIFSLFLLFFTINNKFG